jgi:hypothetical protein
MIPQAELDRALARWKARTLGHEAPTPGPVVAGEASYEEATYAGAREMDAETSSGVVVLGDGDFEGQDPDRY